MGNFKNKLLENFCTIPNSLVYNTGLSIGARLTYVFMASKPSGWNFSVKPMTKEIGCSEDSLHKYINELIKEGWLVKEGQRKEKGKFSSVEYTLMDSPCRKFSVTEKIRDGKNPSQNNTDSRVIDIINNPPVFNNSSNSNTRSKLLNTSPQGESSKKSKIDFEKIFEGYGAEWIELFKEWLEYKREKKSMYKGEKSMRTMAKKLFEMAGGDIKTARQIVEQSMANNWQGLFELKADSGEKQKTGRYKGDSTIGTDFTYKP